MQNDKLVVGLGNPGKEYERTRHNLGAMVVWALAERLRVSFSKEKKVLGELAKCNEEGVLLLLPDTYMNCSGDAVRRCLDYFKIETQNILIVADDIAIPFGTHRFRESGSSGGHNGLKSVEVAVGTREYARLRVGVGDRAYGDLADHVLSRFSKEEQTKLPEVIDEGVKLAIDWIKENNQ